MIGLAVLAGEALPTETISRGGDLPPELASAPSGPGRFFSVLVTAENLFWVLAVLLAVSLLAPFGWWREAGFNRPARWRNLRLLLFPFAVGALAFLGGTRVSGPLFLAASLLPVLAATLGEGMLYRGIMWRALVPPGGAPFVLRAVVVTSLLSGAVAFGRLTLARPWPEALLLAALTVCGGFTYAALRWRTASVWPAIAAHLAFALPFSISTPDTVPYLLPLLAMACTVGFVAYGLFLLRNPQSRSDGATRPDV